ncbi:unnamed protein product, partial [Amoebophrya sp. A120]|eukprot:GSA120T00011956001.1
MSAFGGAPSCKCVVAPEAMRQIAAPKTAHTGALYLCSRRHSQPMDQPKDFTPAPRFKGFRECCIWRMGRRRKKPRRASPWYCGESCRGALQAGPPAPAPSVLKGGRALRRRRSGRGARLFGGRASTQ